MQVIYIVEDITSWGENTCNEFYVRVAREQNIHIFEFTCNVLYMVI